MRWVLIAVLFFSGWCAALPAAAGELFVAFWNVENLFDLQDDPAVEGDEEFTPEGPKQWTAERLRIKLHNLARVIKDMNEHRGPDILGLCEVENRWVIEQLIERLGPLGRNYGIVHRDSPSRRGIDAAIIFDQDRMKLQSSAFHFVNAEQTRDIVEACFEVAGNQLYVFANHWPARYHPPSMRFEAARTLRRRVDKILQADPRAEIIILGDLNDLPGDPSIRRYLGATDKRPLPSPTALFLATAPPRIPVDRGTYVYQNRWQTMDHIVLSAGLLDRQGLRWKEGSTSTILHRYQLYVPRDPKQIPRPSRSYSGNYFHPSGYSDHLPVACVLLYEGTGK